MPWLRPWRFSTQGLSFILQHSIYAYGTSWLIGKKMNLTSIRLLVGSGISIHFQVK